MWADVRTYLDKGDAPSATQAMEDVFARHADPVEEAVSALGDIPAHGTMVALQGDIVALDLFDHRDTFGRAWPALLRGYAMDAVLDGQRTFTPLTLAAARQRLRELTADAALSAGAVPGVGRYHAVRGSRIAGGISTHEGRAVHVALFPALAEA